LLDVSNNKITSFGDISAMPALKTFYLKANRFKEFKEKLPEFPSLSHIDLRENKIAKLTEIKKFSQWPKCVSLDLTGTPLEEEHGEGVRKEILIVLEQFTSINAQEVNEEDRKEANEEKEERHK